VTFEFLVEVRPTLAIERLSGFTVKRTVPPVTDAHVEQQLEQLRRDNAPLRPIETGKPQPGDHIQVTMATLTDGEAGEPRPYQLEVGSGQALPEMEERMLELEPGQTEDIVIRFPDDYGDESKRGQAMSVRVTLNEIKRLDLPAADDDFAREVGDFESIDDLRTAIREDLGKAAEREADAGVRRELMEQITSANQVPAPRPMVERVIRMYGRGYGVPDDQLDKFAAEFGPIAESQVKRDLVLQHVIDQEQLKATDDEIDERIERIAKARKQDPGKVYAALQQENRIKELEQSITEEKVFDFLLKQSTVTES
jgi:trigger factor